MRTERERETKKNTERREAPLLKGFLDAHCERDGRRERQGRGKVQGKQSQPRSQGQEQSRGKSRRHTCGKRSENKERKKLLKLMKLKKTGTGRSRDFSTDLCEGGIGKDTAKELCKTSKKLLEESDNRI